MMMVSVSEQEQQQHLEIPWSLGALASSGLGRSQTDISVPYFDFNDDGSRSAHSVAPLLPFSTSSGAVLLPTHTILGRHQDVV